MHWGHLSSDCIHSNQKVMMGYYMTLVYCLFQESVSPVFEKKKISNSLFWGRGTLGKLTRNPWEKHLTACLKKKNKTCFISKVISSSKTSKSIIDLKTIGENNFYPSIWWQFFFLPAVEFCLTRWELGCLSNCLNLRNIN